MSTLAISITRSATIGFVLLTLAALPATSQSRAIATTGPGAAGIHHAKGQPTTALGAPDSAARSHGASHTRHQPAAAIGPDAVVRFHAGSRMRAPGSAALARKQTHARVRSRTGAPSALAAEYTARSHATSRTRMQTFATMDAALAPRYQANRLGRAEIPALATAIIDPAP